MLKHTAYEQIFEYVYEHHRVKVGGNCIAEAKEKAGLPVRTANNRKDPDQRVTTCPEHVLEFIFEAFRHFKMMD